MAGESAAFGNILLIPEKLKSDCLSNKVNYIDLISLPSKDSFLVKKGPSLQDFYSFNGKKEALGPLVIRAYPHYGFPVISIFETKESTALIAYGGILRARKYLLINLHNKSAAIKDITRLFSDKPISVIGSPGNKNVIFALYKSHIDQLDIATMSLYPKFIEHIKGFGLSGRWLYMLGKDNVLFRTTLDKEQSTPLSGDKFIPEHLFSKSRFYKIQVLENDIFLFWGDRGDLITTLPPYNITKDEVLGFDFLNQKKQLMYWTKDVIGITDFSRKSREDIKEPLSETHIHPQTIYAQGKYISQCFWVYKGTHILFRDKDEVFLIELAPDGKHHIEHMTNVKHNSDIFFSEENGHLYYLNHQGNLMKIGIIPEEEKR